MYKLLSCKDYKYYEYEDHIEYGKAQMEDYKYCKTIKGDDWIGKLSEEQETKLPYYHPWWRQLRRQRIIEEIERCEGRIRERNKVPNGKFAREIEGLHQSKKSLKEILSKMEE